MLNHLNGLLDIQCMHMVIQNFVIFYMQYNFINNSEFQFSIIKFNKYISSLHPGVVRTDLGAELFGGWRKCIYYLIYPFWWFMTKSSI